MSQLRLPLLILISFTSVVLGLDSRSDEGGKTTSSTKIINVNEWETLLNGNEKSSAQFPEAKVENAYKEWRPVDGGHPMRDPTILYAPPSLERVVFESSFSETERSSRANHEIDDVGQGRSASNSFQRAIVIKAEPSVRKNDGKYSVYGSPDINYSQYYIDPPKSNPHLDEDGLLPEERVSPYEAFQREYFGSAVESRSADPYQEYTGERDDDRSSSSSRYGGGFQYIDPPNKDSYYYYSDDSPYYKAKLSIHPTELFTQAPPPAEIKDDGPKRRNYDVLPSESDEDASAVVYTFERENGQRQKVGVIFKRDSLDGPQINRVFSSNKNTVLRNPKKYSSSLRPIPINLDHSPPTLRPNVEEPSHGDLVSGKISHVYHGYKYHKKLPPPSLNYPLGNPFAASSLQTRPKFFKPQKSPPIYKIAPHKLEGIFGPAIPKLERGQHIHPPHRTIRRNDVEPRIVYKTVRDIEYSQPSSILRVKDSGELYNPHLDSLSAPPGKEGRIVLTTETPWQPDFSDALVPTEKFNLIPKNERRSTSRPLKFPGNPKRHITQETKPSNPVPIVIGANYDDNPSRGQEFEDFENEELGKKSPNELYELCLIEVPEYLRNVLCPPLLEKEKKSRTINIRQKGTEKKKVFNTRRPFSKTTKPNLKPSVIRSQSKIKVYRPTSTTSTSTTHSTTTSTASSTTTLSPESISQSSQSPLAKKSESDKKGLLSRLSDYLLSDSLPSTENKKKSRRKGTAKRRKLVKESDITITSPVIE